MIKTERLKKEDKEKLNEVRSNEPLSDDIAEWIYDLVKEDRHTSIAREPYEYDLCRVYISFCIDNEWYFMTALEKYNEYHKEYKCDDFDFGDSMIMLYEPPVGYIKKSDYSTKKTVYVEYVFLENEHFPTGNVYTPEEMKKII